MSDKVDVWKLIVSEGWLMGGEIWGYQSLSDLLIVSCGNLSAMQLKDIQHENMIASIINEDGNTIENEK
jgi:hypothetical protein